MQTVTERFLRYVSFDTKRQEYDLYFEPVYTDSAVDMAKAGGNIVYHVTSKENYNKIKRQRGSEESFLLYVKE